MTKFSDYTIVSLDSGLGIERTRDGLVEFIDLELVTLYAESTAVLRAVLTDDGRNLDNYAPKGIDVDEIHHRMRLWLDEYMTITRSVDYSDGDIHLTAGFQDLVARRDRFLAGDYTPLKVVWQLYWMSKDGQGSYDGDDYGTRAEAETARRAFATEILGQCTDDEQREGILAGTMDLVLVVDGEIVGKWITIPVRTLVDTLPAAA